MNRADEPRSESHPLWLPKGSIRAILAFMLVGAGIWAAFAHDRAASTLTPLAAMVAGFYFKVRRAESTE